MISLPEFIKLGIAIRNRYGYGKELERWRQSLSEAQKEAVRLWASEFANSEEVEKARERFKEITNAGVKNEE